MMLRQAARWKNVACGVAATNASQRFASPSAKRLTMQALTEYPSLAWSGMPHPPSLHTIFGGLQRNHRIVRAARGKEHPVHAIETEIAQQPLTPRRRALEVDVMAHAVLQRHAGHPRLFGIDFPRMEIEHAGGAILPVDAPKSTPEHRVLQQAEITAAAARPIASPQPYRGHRHFEHAGAPGEEREARRRRHAVQVMMDGHDAGAVPIAGLAQFVMRPEGGRADRIAGCAVAVHRRAADVFEQVFGAGDALAELVARDVRQALVTETMACDLMAPGADVPHQRRKALRDPTEHKERRTDPVAPEQFQHPSRVGFDTYRPARPVLAADALFEGCNLEIVLDVHRHRVGDRAGFAQPRAHQPFRPECRRGGSAVTASLPAGAGGDEACSISLNRTSARINCSRISLRLSSSAAISLSRWAVAAARSLAWIWAVGVAAGSSVCGTSGISSRISSSTVLRAASSSLWTSSR